MRRALLWLLISACVWEFFVFLYTRPRFWLALASVAERTAHGALHIHGMASRDQEGRDAAATASRARPRTGDTITDIEEFLRRRRHP